MTSFVSSAEKRKWSCVLGHELYRKIYIHCPTEKNKKKGKCDEVNFQHDRVRWYVGDSQSWVRIPWLAREETPGP